MNKKLNFLRKNGNYEQLASVLNAMPSSDAAAWLQKTDDECLTELCRFLSDEVLSAALIALPADKRRLIVSELGDEKLNRVTEKISAADTLRIVDGLPEPVALRLVKEVEIKTLIERRDYRTLKPLLSYFPAADIALILSDADKDLLPVLFRILPKDLAADAFVELDPDLQESLISGFSDSELKLITDRLFVDDTVDILEEMPANVVKRILAGTDSKKRDVINEILKYPRQSAGSVMTVEFVRVRPEMTVAEAFEQIRVTGIDKKTIYTLYVTDSRAKLVGIVTVKKLLLSPQDALLRDIMTENVVYGHTYDDKEETARTIDKYGFLALPVVDRENRLVGIVTVDDAMTVIQEENTEDIEKIHAIVPTDKPYLKTSVWELFVHRLPWLLILMISATFTGIILNTYESSLSAIGGSLLIACVPMLMDTGGNAGSQASVTVIRGLALGEIRMRDIFRIQWKELRAAGLLAVCLGAVCFAKLMLIDNLMFGYDYTPVIAAIVSLSLFITVLLAKFVGCSLPLVAKAMHLDPAVVASPFITTVVDALSLIVYCNIAIAFLG